MYKEQVDITISKNQAMHTLYLVQSLYTSQSTVLKCCMIKYSMRGGADWQTQHETKLSAAFAMKPHPECCILLYNTSTWCFTFLLVMHGRTVYSKLSWITLWTEV